MTEQTSIYKPMNDTIYRFLILALLAIIALSSVLIVIGLNKPRFVASVCGARGNQIFIFSNGRIVNTQDNNLLRC